MSGSGKQVFVKILQWLSTRITPDSLLADATAKVRAGLLLHGSSSDDVRQSVVDLAWITKHDEEGHVCIQGIGTSQSQILLPCVFEAILDSPGVRDSVKSKFKVLTDREWESVTFAIWAILSAVQMQAERLSVEQEDCDVDEWMRRCRIAFGDLLYPNEGLADGAIQM